MKYITFTLLALCLIAFSSCGSLHSTTYIQPHDAFVLGNNLHGKFSVKMTNTSDQSIQVEMHPNGGGQHSLQTIAAGKTTHFKTDRNTAVHFMNNSADTVAIQLTVRGDVNLSMGYQGR